MVGDQPAKVRCRACYNDHDFRREQAPPTKKELKTAQLLKEALEAGELAPDELILSELPDPELPDPGMPGDKTKTA